MPARAPRAPERGEQRRGDAARAGADDVEVGRARDLAARPRSRGPAPRRSSRGPSRACAARRVAPADDEDLVALRDQVLDDRAAGREVPDVELVDLRRHDEDRARPDLVGLRRVLDQLQVVLGVDDRARA